MGREGSLRAPAAKIHPAATPQSRTGSETPGAGVSCAPSPIGAGRLPCWSHPPPGPSPILRFLRRHSFSPECGQRPHTAGVRAHPPRWRRDGGEPGRWSRVVCGNDVPAGIEHTVIHNVVMGGHTSWLSNLLAHAPTLGKDRHAHRENTPCHTCRAPRGFTGLPETLEWGPAQADTARPRGAGWSQQVGAPPHACSSFPSAPASSALAGALSPWDVLRSSTSCGDWGWMAAAPAPPPAKAQPRHLRTQPEPSGPSSTAPVLCGVRTPRWAELLPGGQPSGSELLPQDDLWLQTEVLRPAAASHVCRTTAGLGASLSTNKTTTQGLEGRLGSQQPLSRAACCPGQC